MAIHLFQNGEGEDAPISAINTTPLVDVMLVLLIIFLITIPVAIHSIPVSLPRESAQPIQATPQTITLAVDQSGALYWNADPAPSLPALALRLAEAARQTPQPEVHLRGDRHAKYRDIAKVMALCRRAGLVRVGFITEPGGTP